MPKKPPAKPRSAKNTLCLLDLDHSRTSLLQSLGSETRLAFGRTVVLRYRYELEARQLRPGNH